MKLFSPGFRRIYNFHFGAFWQRRGVVGVVNSKVKSRPAGPRSEAESKGARRVPAEGAVGAREDKPRRGA